jgi:hypothetical protein
MVSIKNIGTNIKRKDTQMDNKEQDNFWGLPIGRELTTDALLKDLWDPSTEEVFTPKHFLGVGWGINFYAIAKKAGVI